MGFCYESFLSRFHHLVRIQSQLFSILHRLQDSELGLKGCLFTLPRRAQCAVGEMKKEEWIGRMGDR